LRGDELPAAVAVAGADADATGDAIVDATGDAIVDAFVDDGGSATGTRPAAETSASRSLIESMVHDLRNPLTALAGNLALLGEELDPQALSAIASRCLADAVALCERSLAMVQSLADVDAAERGVMRLRRAATAVRPIVEAAVLLAKVDADARELTVEVDVPRGAAAEVDGRLLAQVVQNLIDNAIRYAPRKGRVVIRAESAASDPGLALWVGNNGPALTPAERAVVFEQEFRAAERSAGPRPGRDLGPSFCRVVVEAHGGTIELDQRPGLPAVFVVRIPDVGDISSRG